MALVLRGPADCCAGAADVDGLAEVLLMAAMALEALLTAALALEALLAMALEAQLTAAIALETLEALTAALHMEKAAEVTATGGTLALPWDDCGDAGAHAKVADVAPAQLTLDEVTMLVSSVTLSRRVLPVARQSRRGRHRADLHRRPVRGQ